MPATAMDIMQGLTALVQGLQANIQRGRGEELKALQMMAGLPGMQLGPAPNAEPTNVFQRLLGMPSYRPGPDGMPVAPMGNSAFTVAKLPSAQDFLTELLGGAAMATPAGSSGAAQRTPETPSMATPGALRIRGGTGGGTMTHARFGLTPEEIENDPEFLALLRTPGATYKQAAQRAAAIRKERIAQVKAQREAQAAGMEIQLKTRELIGRHYIRVRDPASLEAVNAQLAATGVIPPEALAALPTTYVPEDIQRIVESALPVQVQTEVSREVAKRRMTDPLDVAKAGTTQQVTGDIRQQQEYAQRLRTDPLDVAKAVNIEQGTAPYKIAAQAAQGAQAAQKAYEGAVGKPLEGEARLRVNTMMQAEEYMKALSTEFTPQERQQYVGLLGAKLKTQQLTQALNEMAGQQTDPKLGRFAALLAGAQSEAFSTGGKALTETEKGIVFGYIPTGKEWSAADFEQKLTLGQTRLGALIDRELAIATTPARDLAARRKEGNLPGLLSKTLTRQAVLEAMRSENARRQAAGQPALTEQDALDAAKAKGYQVTP